MCNLSEVIAKSIELNNAIKKLNEETKVLNSIVEEKRDTIKADILNKLNKYAEIMESLDISFIELRTYIPMFYSGSNKCLGISIRRHSYGTQINLGCLSNVMDGFYAYHSIGWVISGVKNEELMDKFCNKWNEVKNILDNVFAEAINAILEDRKEKAIAERENAINDLTVVSR